MKYESLRMIHDLLEKEYKTRDSVCHFLNGQILKGSDHPDKDLLDNFDQACAKYREINSALEDFESHDFC